MRLSPLTLAALALATAAPVQAQKDSLTARQRTEWRGYPQPLVRVIQNSNRGRLGVLVNLRSRDTDSIGAYIEAVTPGGPADKAGLKSGDIVTRLDGTSLLGGKADDSGQSLPGLRLVELAARLDPDDTVKVEYRRGKNRRTATLITDQEPGMAWAGQLERMPFETRLMPQFKRMESGGAGGIFFYGTPLADLELAPLNPDLGQYFGTSDGVLVISAPKDSRLGLKGGDVILSVDGRKPSSPAHLLRILRSYNAGEQFKLEILRNRKRQTVSGQLDGSGERSELPMRIEVGE